MIDPCDCLRDIASLCKPDPRMGNIAGSDMRPITQRERLEIISRFSLSEAVPEPIRIHFDTARNLFLYAWFVYRFHVVAEQYALTTLEMATKMRLTELDFINNKNGKPLRGLSDLLTRARKQGLIRNETLPNRDRLARNRAEARKREEDLHFMMANNIEVMRCDDAPAVPTPDDYDQDWLTTFIKLLPDIRNELSHGSEQLYPMVLYTFDVVVALINQMYGPMRLPHHAEA